MKSIREQREVIERATPGPWKTGKHNGVVAENLPQGPNTHTGHYDTEYYGGYLIGESILRKADENFIAESRTAWPELLEWAVKAREHLKEVSEYWTGPIADKAKDLIGELPEE